MKKLIALLLVLVMLLCMTACGSKQEPAEKPADTDTPASETTETPAEPEKEEAPAEEEKEEVTIEAHIVSSDWIDAWDVMEERFEEQYPYIDVVSVGNSGQDAEFLTTRIAANDLPHIVSVDINEMWRTLVSEGKVMDLSELDVAQDIPQSYRDAFTYNGTLYGLTQGAAFSAIYYNMAMLRQAGWETEPTCWEELIQCCADLQAAGLPAITVPGDQATNMYFLLELMIANEAARELGVGVFEEQFMNGEFDLTAYPTIAEKIKELVPYFIPGAAGNTQDDTIALMAEGQAAICLAGNWLAATISDAIATNTGDPADAKAGLPPFNSEGNPVWISVSPETAFGISVDETRSEAEQEATLLFFNWLHQPENFMLIQNARGTVPVLSTMTDEHILLPDSMNGVVPAMNAAPYIKMGFNIFTTEYSDVSWTCLRDVLSGNMSVDDMITTCGAKAQESYMNKG